MGLDTVTPARRGFWLVALASTGTAALSLGLFGPTKVQGHGSEPPVPVEWPTSTDCLAEVDLASTQEFRFSFDVPLEDQAAPGELPDSHTVQFVAFCRQWPIGSGPPRYVSTADLQRAVDAGFEPPETLDDPEGSLETSLEWEGCWQRVTPDSPRIPISFAAASRRRRGVIAASSRRVKYHEA